MSHLTYNMIHIWRSCTTLFIDSSNCRGVVKLEQNVSVLYTLSQNDLNPYSAAFNSKVLIMWSSLSSRLNWPSFRLLSVHSIHPKEEASMLIVLEGFSLTIGAKLDGIFICHQSMSCSPSFGIVTISSKLPLCSFNASVLNFSVAP